jgi:hypothetical protein
MVEWFKCLPRVWQTACLGLSKDYKIGISGFSAKHARFQQYFSYIVVVVMMSVPHQHA